MNMKLTLAQLNLEFGDTTSNLLKLKNLLEETSPGSFVLLPELWTSSYDLKNTNRLVIENELVLEEVKKLALDHNVFIGGSLLLQKEGKIYNDFTLIDPAGKIAATYQKIHLFRLMDEEKWMHSGNNLSTIDLNQGKAGLSICYDLRFPELFRKYALLGCDIILLVAEWPIQRIEHWKILLQARAIENQMFIAAVNCVGRIGNTEFGGSSIIVDPWGNILTAGSQKHQEILTASIDLMSAENIRKQIPVFADRRPEIYDL